MWTYVALHYCATNAKHVFRCDPRYDHLRKTIAVSKLDLYLHRGELMDVSTPLPLKRFERLTYSSWRSSPRESLAALRFDSTFSL